MAKAIQLAGGAKGKKNTNARSASAQKPYKSKPAKTKEAGTTYGGRKVYAAGSNNPKSGASDVNSVTVPEMPHKNAQSFWLKWFKAHNADVSSSKPNRSATSKPADMVGSTRTAKSGKSSVNTPKASGPKITYQARAAKAGKKPTVLGS